MSKPVFMLMNTPEGRKIDLADCLSVLWHGLPLDLATAGYLSAPLWLALSFSVWVRPRETSPLRIWSAGIYVLYIGVVSILLSVILVADCCLYGYWGIKLDGTVLAYLDSPKGAAASVSGGYAAASVRLYSSFPSLFSSCCAACGRKVCLRCADGVWPRLP